MRVIFKHENEDTDGTPVGPVLVIENEEADEPTFDTTRPYQEECECDDPKLDGEATQGPCANCGKWHKRMYRLPDAEAIAALAGVELEES